MSCISSAKEGRLPQLRTVQELDMSGIVAAAIA
jgi:hypothetical protein